MIPDFSRCPARTTLVVELLAVVRPFGSRATRRLGEAPSEAPASADLSSVPLAWSEVGVVSDKSKRFRLSAWIGADGTVLGGRGSGGAVGEKLREAHEEGGGYGNEDRQGVEASGQLRGPIGAREEAVAVSEEYEGGGCEAEQHEGCRDGAKVFAAWDAADGEGQQQVEGEEGQKRPPGYEAGLEEGSGGGGRGGEDLGGGEGGKEGGGREDTQRVEDHRRQPDKGHDRRGALLVLDVAEEHPSGGILARGEGGETSHAGTRQEARQVVGALVEYDPRHHEDVKKYPDGRSGAHASSAGEGQRPARGVGAAQVQDHRLDGEREKRVVWCRDGGRGIHYAPFIPSTARLRYPDFGTPAVLPGPRLAPAVEGSGA